MALPTDTGGSPIQALRPKVTGGSHVLTAGLASTRNATAFASSTRAVQVHAVEDIWFRFGASDVEATTNDHFLGSGKSAIFSLGSEDLTRATHIAVEQVTTGGAVYVSELE